MATPRLMGAEVKRKEDPRLITGTSSYVGDLALPGMHYVAFVRSPHAHARIRKIDTAPALRRPGVFKVVTGNEIRKLSAALPIAGAGEGGSTDASANIGRKHYPLSVDRVRHVGEAVAAVIATSEEIAVDAAADVVVDWDTLPAVADVFQAMAKGAPQIHDDAPGNIEHQTPIKSGDPDGAFSKAKRVVKQRMVSQRLCGVPMEGRAVLAAPDATSGGLVVWATNQAPHGLRNDLATALGMPQNLIRVIAPEVGGGFGVKFGCYPEDATVAALARHFRMPLRWTETRLEHMMATTHGRAQVTDLEAAVEDDGTITALRMRVTADIGAYPVFTFIPDLTLSMGVGVYKFTNVDLQSTCVFTNSTSVAAYRGAGRPEAAYYLERLMDVIAAELGLAPEQVRRKNFIPPSAFPYQAPPGQHYDSGEYDKALTKALDLAGYGKLRAEQNERLQRRDRKLLGIGMSCYVEMCGFGPFESAVVRVEPGGTRSLVVGGSAIMGAALKVQVKARKLAAHMLEAAEADVVCNDGRYQVKGVPDKALTLDAIAARAYGEGLPEGIESGLESTEFFRPPALVYPFGAHVAVVEIDRETGRIAVRDFISVDDCGVRISPMLVAGQVHGGLAQGIAQALIEELVYGADGQLVTGTLMDYAVPHADDLPSFKTDQTVTPSPRNPMGAKGIGEAATIGATPAIVNAVVDALKSFGVRHLDMPLRPERVWQALKG